MLHIFPCTIKVEVASSFLVSLKTVEQSDSFGDVCVAMVTIIFKTPIYFFANKLIGVI